MKTIDNVSAENRVRALLYYFGWQGGTIHQIADATGCSVNQLLYGLHGDERLGGGFSAVRTCDTEWRRDTLAPRYRADWAYWRDVIHGFWATGPLDGQPA